MKRAWKTDPELWARLKPIAREMRRQPTATEDVLWRRLRNRQLNGHKFRRQHSIDRFIVDFYCADAKLVVEVDGSVHQYTHDQDLLRNQYLESLGLTVLRFKVEEVEGAMESVIARIAEALQ